MGANYVVQLFRATDYPNVVYSTTTTNSSSRYTFTDVKAPRPGSCRCRRTRGGVPLGTATVEIGPSDTPNNVNVKVSDG